MHKQGLFRSLRRRESSDQAKTTSTRKLQLKTNSENVLTTPTSSIQISPPIINSNWKVVITDKDQSNENPNEEQTTHIEEQILRSEKAERMSGEYEHIYHEVDYRVTEKEKSIKDKLEIIS